MDAPTSPLVEPGFWTQPLADRMARIAELREVGPFEHVTYLNPLTGQEEAFDVALRYADVIEISRRPKDFCSGKGAVSIPDMPEEALEFFGSFIN
ncbi:MAG: cytochrome P450, partial [Acidimicrobiales bacterium]|nr:cytochrome P450 [Acidimicrobiales bacterium]